MQQLRTNGFNSVYMEYRADLMVAVLCKEYPEIAAVITEKIKEVLPAEQLTDLSHIKDIIDVFKRIKGIKVDNWTNGKGKVNITYERELLLAVILLFYDPEKMMQLVQKNTAPGVLKQTSKLTGASQEVLSMSVPGVTVAFKVYEDFRSEVYRIYHLIRTEKGLFEGNVL